jgi:hypothetical protein
MFGEKKLLRDGMEGRAVVLKADYRWNGMGGTHHIYRVELRLKFDDGSTAELHTKLDKNMVDEPALEAEFQRSQAKAEAKKASRIADSEPSSPERLRSPAAAALRRPRTSRQTAAPRLRLSS